MILTCSYLIEKLLFAFYVNFIKDEHYTTYFSKKLYIMKKISKQIDISILEKAKILESINRYLSKYESIKDKCFACNIIKNTLIVGTIDSSALNLLRNYHREILKDVNSEMNELLGIKLNKVRFKIIKNPKIN